MSPLLDALLRQYPEFESQFLPSQSGGWGPMFDETYQTPGQQAQNDALQAYLSRALGYNEPMDLDPNQWLDQMRLAQTENDYRAQAGLGASSRAGYEFESPESAQQNALKYAWLDVLARGGLNPHTQQASSFSPQFGEIYVDPFIDEKTGREGGFIQDLARVVSERKRGTSNKTNEGSQRFARDLSPQSVLPPVPPELTKAEDLPKYLEKQETKARQRRTEERAIRAEGRAVTKEEREERAEKREIEKEVRRRNALGREARQIENSIGGQDVNATMRRTLKALGFQPGSWQFREQAMKILEERDRLNAEHKDGTTIVLRELQSWLEETKRRQKVQK